MGDYGDRRRRVDEGGGHGGGGHERRPYSGGGGSGGGGSAGRSGGYNNKRPREHDAPVDDDPDRALLASIFRVADLPRVRKRKARKKSRRSLPIGGGDTRFSPPPPPPISRSQPQGAPPLDAELTSLASSLLRGDGATRPEAVAAALTDCALALSPKAPWYGALGGLLNAGSEPLGASIASSAASRLAAAVAGVTPGGDRRDEVRLAARWVAALAGAGVVGPASAVGALRALVDGGAAALAAAAPSPRTAQPWTDALVGAALAALPYGGLELASGGAAEGVRGLLGAAGAYVAARPRAATSAPGLSAFWGDLAGACGAPPPLPLIDAPPEASDSGAASYLTILHAAAAAWWGGVEAVVAAGGDARALAALLPSLPSPLAVAPALEAGLAAGRPHALPAGLPSVPLTPPAAAAAAAAGAAGPDEVAAAVLGAHPPAGRAGLLPPSVLGVAPPSSGGPGAGLDLLLAEAYVADTLRSFDGDRVALARRLAHGLPLGPPAPATDAAAAAGGATAAAAHPAATTSPRLEPLLAAVLFSQLLAAPAPELPPLAYCAAMVDLCKLLPAFPRAMSACVRESFARLGPPAPLDPVLADRLTSWLAYHLSNFEFMWPWARWASVLEAPPHDPARRFVGGLLDALMRLSYRARLVGVLPEGGFVDVLLPPEPAISPVAPLAGGVDWASAPAEAVRAAAAAEVAALVRRKAGDEAILAWARARGGGSPAAAVAAAAGADGPAAALLGVVLHGLLAAGAKSFTHMTTALERHGGVVRELAADVDADGGDGAVAAVRAAAAAWASSPARAAQAVDRLLALGLVPPAAAIRWALAAPPAGAPDYEGSALPPGTPPAPPFFALGDGAASRAELAAREVLDTAATASASPGDLVLALTLMRDALAAGPGGEGGKGADAATAAWRVRSLAALRGFARSHHAALAPVAEGLRTGPFALGEAPEDVRRALLPVLEL